MPLIETKINLINYKKKLLLTSKSAIVIPNFANVFSSTPLTEAFLIQIILL